MVVEGHLHGVAGPEAHGIKGLGIAPVVVVAILGVKNGSGRQKHAAQFAYVLGQQPAQTGPHGLEEDEFLFFENGDVLDIGQRFEFFDVELGAIKALFHVLGIAVGIRQQILELDQVVLSAFAFIQHFAAAVYAFRAVFAGHEGAPVA